MIWEQGSANQDEKALVFIRKASCCSKDNEFRIGFMNIELRNVDVVATRVVEGTSRSG